MYWIDKPTDQSGSYNMMNIIVNQVYLWNGFKVNIRNGWEEEIFCKGWTFTKLQSHIINLNRLIIGDMLIPAAGTCITTFTSIGTKKGVSVSLAEGKYQYWQYPYQRPKEAKKRHN